MKIQKYIDYIKESLDIPEEIIDNFQELEDDGIRISYKKVGPNKNLLRHLHEEGILLSLPINYFDKFDEISTIIMNLSNRLISFQVDERILYSTMTYYFNYDKTEKPYHVGNDANNSHLKIGSIDEISNLIKNQNEVIQTHPNQRPRHLAGVAIRGIKTKICEIKFYIRPLF